MYRVDPAKYLFQALTESLGNHPEIISRQLQVLAVSGKVITVDGCFRRSSEVPQMRFLLRVSFPVEAGNASARNGFKAIQSILQEQKPEAAYFLTQDGRRTGLLILDIEDASQLAEFAEPWFLALNAEAYWSPVMVPSDLEKAAPAIAEAVKNCG
jgi:hypothetical protein